MYATATKESAQAAKQAEADRIELDRVRAAVKSTLSKTKAMIVLEAYRTDGDVVAALAKTVGTHARIRKTITPAPSRPACKGPHSWDKVRILRTKGKIAGTEQTCTQCYSVYRAVQVTTKAMPAANDKKGRQRLADMYGKYPSIDSLDPDDD